MSPPQHGGLLTTASKRTRGVRAADRALGGVSGAHRSPVFARREPDYLAKLSSEPGARGATAEGESENTSTSSPPEDGGAPAGAGVAAPRPRRSADGEGVDCKTGKDRISAEASGAQRPPGVHARAHAPPSAGLVTATAEI